MRQHHEVTFLPEGRSMTVAEGTTLLQAAREGGLNLEAPCDGRGSCGKCRVRVSGQLAPPDEFEVSQLGNLLRTGLRLACRTKIYGAVQAQIESTGRESFVALTEARSSQWSFDPPVRNRYQEGRPCYGIALDIGTTSIAAELIDLINGKSLGAEACLNPQTAYGGDVLTRISFAAEHTNGTQKLQAKAAEGISSLIERLTAVHSISKEDIYEMVVAGNTTMLHLFLGVSPRSLAQAPFRPVFTQQVDVSPAKAGLHMATGGVITLLPSAAAFIGADIVAGLLAVGHRFHSGTALFIDIGTNGEIVASKNGKLAATSSAAGPALEGMNISCGCRAEAGAIEAVAVDDNYNVNIEVIGTAPLRGICGSGLIDLIAELVRCGLIEPNGRFAQKNKLAAVFASRMVDVNERPAFMVAEEGRIYLSQKDVRQVQLAKGAIAAAIELLLQKLDISYADIEEVLVAGAFGAHLKPSSLIGIGLLPPECEGKIRFVGNTAKEGAKAVLLNRQAASNVVELAQAIEVIDLSSQPEFQDCFIRALSYPDKNKIW